MTLSRAIPSVLCFVFSMSMVSAAKVPAVEVPVAADASDLTAGENSGCVDEPPANLFLADSPWPMSHRNPYNQASSPVAGPTRAVDAQPEFLPGDPVPITLAVSGAYPDGRRAIWGTTMKHVFKIEAHGNRMNYVARLSRSQSKKDAISGAYSLVDKDGVYYVPRGPSIESYRDANPGEIESPIAKAQVFTLPENLRQSADDSIVGINLTYDGRIVFLTRRGLLGSLSRQLDDFVWLRIADPEDEISNSFAVDESGGMFVVTSREMKRVQWDGAKLDLSWSVPYRTNDVRSNGRLGTGSGTTPTLVGVGQQDKFVVISDGQSVMNMILFWRDDIPADWTGLSGRDRRIAAEVPITFGDPAVRRSTTEQSLTVRGYGIVAVSNLYGKLSPLLRQLVRRQLGNDVHNVTIYRSNRPEIAPYGIEKFQWNPETRQLESSWANRSLSCPNGIPTMSAATGLFYCMGQREGQWTLEAVSWATGESVFHQPLTSGSKNNSFYSATEIAAEGTILTGTYGGILRFGSESSTAGAAPALLRDQAAASVQAVSFGQ